MHFIVSLKVLAKAEVGHLGEEVQFIHLDLHYCPNLHFLSFRLESLAESDSDGFTLTVILFAQLKDQLQYC